MNENNQIGCADDGEKIDDFKAKLDENEKDNGNDRGIEENVNQTAENTEKLIEANEIAENAHETVQRTEEELALEKQLNDVQKQLVSLASLPSTIQATLDAVTRQLAELLPTFQLIATPESEGATNGNGKPGESSN